MSDTWYTDVSAYGKKTVPSNGDVPFYITLMIILKSNIKTEAKATF